MKITVTNKAGHRSVIYYDYDANTKVLTIHKLDRSEVFARLVEVSKVLVQYVDAKYKAIELLEGVASCQDFLDFPDMLNGADDNLLAEMEDILLIIQEFKQLFQSLDGKVTKITINNPEEFYEGVYFIKSSDEFKYWPHVCEEDEMPMFWALLKKPIKGSEKYLDHGCWQKQDAPKIELNFLEGLPRQTLCDYSPGEKSQRNDCYKPTEFSVDALKDSSMEAHGVNSVVPNMQTIIAHKLLNEKDMQNGIENLELLSCKILPKFVMDVVEERLKEASSKTNLNQTLFSAPTKKLKIEEDLPSESENIKELDKKIETLSQQLEQAKSEKQQLLLISKRIQANYGINQ